MSKARIPAASDTDFSEPQKIFPQKEYLSVKEAACYLNISMNSIYKLTSSKTWPVYKPGGKKIYLKKEDIDEWLTKQNSSTAKNITQKVASYFLNKTK